MAWIVRLIRAPKINDFRSGFFPRIYYYKKDAQELQQEVADKEGEAVVEKYIKLLHKGPKK